MNELQTIKVLEVIAPQAIVNNASWTTNEIDTDGYDFLSVFVQIGATDVAMAALKLQSSATSGSGFADVTGLDMDGSTDIDGSTAVLPSATDDNSVIVFQVDLRGQKRYWDLVATAGSGSTGTYASAMAVLSKAEYHSLSTTDTGAETVLRIP